MDPFHPEATLGPVINETSAEKIRHEIQAAISQGATPLIDTSYFPMAKPGTAFVAPQLLVNVKRSMSIINDEIFGPVAAIIPVQSDEEAIEAINASKFGLTASIWTQDCAQMEALSQRLEVGTVFMNRCDYLDPCLVWTGTKESGKGYALSEKGFDAFVQLKSLHFRLG